MTRTMLHLPMAVAALALLTAFATLAHNDQTQFADDVTRARTQAARAKAAMTQANRELARQRSATYQTAQAARYAREQP